MIVALKIPAAVALKSGLKFPHTLFLYHVNFVNIIVTFKNILIIFIRP